jgi:GLPGLI family protein
MKPFITLLLFSFITFNALSQKNFQGKATYMSKTTMDMSRFDRMPEERKKQIMARMKSVLEKKYTLSFTKTESLFKEEAKLAAPGSSKGPRWAMASNGQGAIYKNLQNDKIIEDVETFSKRFLIIEKMEQPEWQLSSESKKIGQYLCYKATLTREDRNIDYANIFRRRGKNNSEKKDTTQTASKELSKPKMETITAWYTPQIPLSTGPKDYYGLPGLILEVNAGRTTMLCTEIIINPKNGIEIKEPKKGKKIDRIAYNAIVKKKSEELREQFRTRRANGGGRRF